MPHSGVDGSYKRNSKKMAARSRIMVATVHCGQAWWQVGTTHTVCVAHMHNNTAKKAQGFLEGYTKFFSR